MRNGYQDEPVHCLNRQPGCCFKMGNSMLNRGRGFAAGLVRGKFWSCSIWMGCWRIKELSYCRLWARQLLQPRPNFIYSDMRAFSNIDSPPLTKALKPFSVASTFCGSCWPGGFGYRTWNQVSTESIALNRNKSVRLGSLYGWVLTLPRQIR
jgi:hypothetical protein